MVRSLISVVGAQLHCHCCIAALSLADILDHNSCHDFSPKQSIYSPGLPQTPATVRHAQLQEEAGKDELFLLQHVICMTDQVGLGKRGEAMNEPHICADASAAENHERFSQIASATLRSIQGYPPQGA